MDITINFSQIYNFVYHSKNSSQKIAIMFCCYEVIRIMESGHSHKVSLYEAVRVVLLGWM